jgi:cytochrome c553
VSLPNCLGSNSFALALLTTGPAAITLAPNKGPRQGETGGSKEPRTQAEGRPLDQRGDSRRDLGPARRPRGRRGTQRSERSSTKHSATQERVGKRTTWETTTASCHRRAGTTFTGADAPPSGLARNWLRAAMCRVRKGQSVREKVFHSELFYCKFCEFFDFELICLVKENSLEMSN